MTPVIAGEVQISLFLRSCVQLSMSTVLAGRAIFDRLRRSTKQHEATRNVVSAISCWFVDRVFTLFWFE
jgi:hypothetical protein